ncbi:hypothetical protein FKP32DRAFT_1592735 [Trametes sanguinea]|nr:hypothetical protein FKP32DRAFT_1592735 [Trametes sanguinea]
MTCSGPSHNGREAWPPTLVALHHHFVATVRHRALDAYTKPWIPSHLALRLESPEALAVPHLVQIAGLQRSKPAASGTSSQVAIATVPLGPASLLLVAIPPHPSFRLLAMSPQRNMGWRKPVPRLTPEPSINSQRHSRSAIRRFSLTIVNKDVPPLPSDWRESIEYAVKEERRYAVYISPPPSPPPKDDVESRPESLAPTLVEEQSEDGMSFEPPHTDITSHPAQRIPLPQEPPVLPRRLSQKSLPQIYRPPTPPLPATHPKLRSVTHSRESSMSAAYTLCNGLVSAERPRATPSPATFAENGCDTSRRVDIQEDCRRRARVPAGHCTPEKQPAGGLPCAYRVSASSTSAGRTASGRSYVATDVCSGVWAALKGWGLHVRAKMSGHAGKY